MKPVEVDFFNGELYRNKLDVADVIDRMEKAREELVQWPVDRLIAVFGEFSKKLMDRKNLIHRLHPNSGIAYIAGWCRKSNLIRLLENSFRTRYILDEFKRGTSIKNRSYRALPRGLVVHWMAGNVPTLGFLSLIQGALTKNANLIKASSQSGDLLALLLENLSQITIDGKALGKALTKTIAVIRYERSRQDIGALISQKADVRVFWGSDEGLKALRSLPTKLDAIDLVFANKTSLMMIDATSLKKIDKVTIAKRIATDVSVFEQKACASPHTLFLETDDEKEIKEFAEVLKIELTKALSSIPKTVPTRTEISAILNLRTQYDMFHDAWYSDGTEFTILSDNDLKLGPPIGNRTLYIRKVDRLERIVDLITPQVQSVGIEAEKGRFEEITSLLAEKGIQRFTEIGEMTQFELPWDGYMLNQELVRWTSRPVI